MREPLLAPAAAVAAGVFAARLASLSFLESLVAGVLCAGLAALALREARPFGGLAVCLLGVLFAGAALESSAPAPAPDRIDEAVDGLDISVPVRLTGWVSRPPEDLRDADRFTLEAETMLRGRPVTGGVQITVNRPLEDPPLRLRYGRRLELLARLRRPRNFRNPGAFDYVGLLERRGVYLTATMRPYAPLLPLEGRRGSRLQALLWDIRGAVRRRFERLRAAAGLEGSRAAAILEASLLGDRRALAPETEADFQRSGTYHALVVSGLHVGVLAGAALWLVRILGGGRRLAAAIAVAAAAAYALLLDAPLPAARAAWMLAAWLAAALVYRARRALNVIAAVALGFLAADPAALFEPGFQLSFGAVFVIAAIAVPLLERSAVPHLQSLRDIDNLDLDPHLDATAAERRVALRRWLDPLASLTRLPKPVFTGSLRLFWLAVSSLVVSTALLVALAAPMAWHFERVAGASPLANLLVLPLITAAVPAGFFALATGWPPAFVLAARLADGMAGAAGLGARELALDRRTPPPPEWLAFLALAAAAAFAVALRWPGRSWRVAAVPAIAGFALIAAHPFPPDLSRDRLELTAIDVGQGDALLLSAPPGEALLVDAGGLPDFSGAARPRLDIGEAVVAPYLRSRSIQRLRALAVTHADADHIGGARAILRGFRVERLWLPAGASDEAIDALRAEAERLGTAVVELAAGDRFRLGEVELEVLNPPADPAAQTANDRSLALLARFGRHRFLLTGDLEKQGEAAVAARLALDAGGVLKVSHHGSRTSSRPALLSRFRPAFAVNSAGYENLYGHPHAEALERLRAARARVLRTDREGLISVSSDGRRLFVSTFARERNAYASAASDSKRR